MLWHSTINVTNHNADNANDLNNYWSRGLTFSDIRLRARLINKQIKYTVIKT